MRSFCLFLSMFFLVGCGGKQPLGRARPVSGEVTYKGQAIAGATVTFYNATESAFGHTDEQGKFHLRTAVGETVPLGDYQVAVSKTDAPPPGPQSMPETYVPPDPNEPPPPPAKDVLPAQYNDPRTSPLKATVSDTGPNDFRLELTD